MHYFPIIAYRPRSRWFVGAVLLLASALRAAEPPGKAASWCKITVPASVKRGESVNVRVRFTRFKEPVWLSCDLKDQAHRLLTWGGPPRELSKDKETTYRLAVPDKPGIESVYAFLYITRGPKDGWQKAIASTAAPRTPVTGRSAWLDLTYRKSWLYVDASNGGVPLVSGDRWQVPVDFYLDPTEQGGKTTLYIWGTGPWIDTPDGKYAKKRGHVGYRGLSGRVVLDKPGSGRHVFTFTVPPGLDLVRRNNPVLLVAGFRDARDRAWPWHVRARNTFVRRRGFFEIAHAVPGNLFAYTQPVRLGIQLKNVKEPGATKELNYTVWDARGTQAARGSVPFTVEKSGQRVEVVLDLKRRGVFLVEFGVPGWEKLHTTFARIPDLGSVTTGGPTEFGMTCHDSAPPDEVWAIARRLGLTTCRRFTRWYRCEPGPGVYRLDGLRSELDAALRHGVRTWLCIVDPPPFAFAGKAKPPGYHPFEFNPGAWRDFVRTASTQLKGHFVGWEWLNEILAGNCRDPVGTYLEMCRIGSETAKAVSPDLHSILAGGLYPRDYRKALLNAGVGRWIGVLPVHYQDGDGVIEARRDLETTGCATVDVWDDESARGANAWGVPPIEDIQQTLQSEWVLRQWPDELEAGCRRIVYFGGRGTAAGSWDYLLDDLGPRPVAATVAVLISKLHGAKPLGSFPFGKAGVFHLFARGERPVLVASTNEVGGERVLLPVGCRTVRVTEYQGNETLIPTVNGTAPLELRRMPIFIEGADVESVTAQVVLEIATARVGKGTSSNVRDGSRVTPRVLMILGQPGRVPVHFTNSGSIVLAGSCRIEPPDAWPEVAPFSFTLPPGAVRSVDMMVRPPPDIGPGAYPARIVVSFDRKKLPRVFRACVLSVVAPDALGNLLPNGDFETAGKTAERPDNWQLARAHVAPSASPPDIPGLGRRVLRFADSATTWLYASNTIPVQGGQTYLYTAWVHNSTMHCGSNLTLEFADGRKKTFFDTQVFQCGEDSPGWQQYSCRKTFPDGVVRAAFSPVAKGAGVAMLDNIRVTVYEGSDYAADATRALRPPVLDGRLDDWLQTAPIPLIGPNQLSGKSEGYHWTPANLCAAAYLMWDTNNLYVAVDVRDDRHVPKTSETPDGNAILDGDSLVLAFDPTGRGPDAASKAFALYVSSARPGGGSGRFTLFRPEQHSGGRRTGHLYRDSSVFGMAFGEFPGGCAYELRIPLSEIGLSGTLGTKFGFSLQLNDSDGPERAARMNWGDGLRPTWTPGAFGIVTLCGPP